MDFLYLNKAFLPHGVWCVLRWIDFFADVLIPNAEALPKPVDGA